MKKFAPILLASLLLFAACGKAMDEKTAYIEASKEVSCMLLQSGLEDKDLEAKTKAIYKKFNFDPEDTVAMTEITQKYANDPALMEAVTEAIAECGSAAATK